VDPVFRQIVEELHAKFLQLLNSSPVRFDALPKPLPKRAIYLFSEGAEHLYVGRTNNLQGRLRNHCRAAAKHNQATFAFRIARQATGFTKATYAPDGSRGR
jgi:hypothetical protein